MPIPAPTAPTNSRMPIAADAAVQQRVRHLGEPRLRHPLGAGSGEREHVVVRDAVVEDVLAGAQVPEERVVRQLRQPRGPTEDTEERGEDPRPARVPCTRAERAPAGGRRRPSAARPDARAWASRSCQSAREMLIIAGPRMTTKIDGKMQNTRGNSILTGAFCACSCAQQATLDAHLVGLRAQEPGDRHTEGVGLQHGEDERRGARARRCARPWRGGRRRGSNRCGSRAACGGTRRTSAPGTAVQVRSSACSKPRPASTEITSRSRMSGSLREISFWRSSILRLSMTSGYMNDTPQSASDPDEQHQTR